MRQDAGGCAEAMNKLITLHVSEEEYATILNALETCRFSWDSKFQVLARKLQEQKIIRDGSEMFDDD